MQKSPSRSGKREEEGYIDPTQSLPEAPPRKCHIVHGKGEEEDCESCRRRNTADWADRYATTVYDLLLHSNVHSCNRGMNKDGTRRKNKALHRAAVWTTNGKSAKPAFHATPFLRP